MCIFLNSSKMYFCSLRSHFRSIKIPPLICVESSFWYFNFEQFLSQFLCDFFKLRFKTKTQMLKEILIQGYQSEVNWICLRTIWSKGPLEMPWVAVFCVSNTPVQTFGSKSEGQPCINFPNFETLFTPENLTKIHSDNLANPNWEWQNRAQASFIMKNSSWVKTRDSKNNQWVIMDTIGIYEYNSKDLIGHGAFAVVYKGRVKMVSHKRQYLFWLSE